MDNESSEKEVNELEKQLQEINEWQNNASNPGYFVGTGRVPVAIRNLYKSPWVMIILGLVLFLPYLFGMISDFNLTTILTAPYGILISLGLIVGGILRIFKK